MNRKGIIKKLGNKGFAISTVLYSLLIMVFLIVVLIMGIMSTNRKNSHDLVDIVEEELNRFSVSTTNFEFNDTGDSNSNVKEYQIPESGWYKIELWGASGGDATSETGELVAGGKGAYTSGITYFEQGEMLYFYIGGTTSTSEGGANGGGTGGSDTGKGGGGATDVRTVSGAWDLKESLQTRMMIAAGGGGADGLGAGSPGGDGGEVYGDSGSVNKTPSGFTYINAKYGGQEGPVRWNLSLPIYDTSLLVGSDGCNGAYYKNSLGQEQDTENIISCGVTGIGGSTKYKSGGGGGAGYMGGGAGTIKDDVAGSGAGGSSFIAGYTNMLYKQEFLFLDTETYYNDDGRYFIDSQMTAGVNEGNGNARIELISKNDKDNKPIKNNNLKNVRYIKDCSYGTTADQTKVTWSEISARDEAGKKVGFKTIKNIDITGKTSLTGEAKYAIDGNLETSVTAKKNDTSETCITVELSNTTNLNEISVVHDWLNSDKPLKKHTLSVSSNKLSWITLIDGTSTDTEMSIPEKTAGTRYTNYSLDAKSAEIPKGVYYIYSALSPYNKALTVKENGIAIESRKATSVQEWAISKVSDDGYYKIVETETNGALQVKDSLGQSGTDVNIASGYDDAYNWTQWKIIPLNDGTYRIQARVGSNYLTTKTDSFYTSSEVQIKSKISGSSLSQRWIIKPAGL